MSHAEMNSMQLALADLTKRLNERLDDHEDALKVKDYSISHFIQSRLLYLDRNLILLF